MKIDYFMRGINKNHFSGFELDDEEKPTGGKEDGKILADRVDSVMRDKFKVLMEMYLKNAYENGYNSTLAFRVIGLYLYCEFKPTDDELLGFRLVEEVNRFITA